MWLKAVYIYTLKQKNIYNDKDQQTDFQTNKLGRLNRYAMMCVVYGHIVS